MNIDLTQEELNDLRVLLAKEYSLPHLLEKLMEEKEIQNVSYGSTILIDYTPYKTTRTYNLDRNLTKHAVVVSEDSACILPWGMTVNVISENIT